MQYSEDESARPSAEPEYEGFDLEKYKKMWREAVDGYAEPRKQHYRDEEYYDGDVKGTGWGHWTETELQKLGLREQPPTTRNHIERKVNSIAGVDQRARSEPRALPRTPKDQKSAEIATDALRFIKEQTRWTFTKADAFLDALKVGFAAVEIGGAEDHVPVTPIEWKDFFFDPRSRRPDFSDARFLGVAKWVDRDVAEATYVPPEPRPPQDPPPPAIPPQPQDPVLLKQWAELAQGIVAQYEAERARLRHEYEEQVKRRQAILDTIRETASGMGSEAGHEEYFEDRPASTFCDQKRERIFVIDMWHRDPQKGWFRCVFTGAGKLFTEEATLVEKDQWGHETKTHPIQAFSLFVSRDVWRYGVVRGMRSPQDEINFRLSKTLHWLMVNQLFYETGAFPDGDVEKARREVARPDGAVGVSQLSKIKVERGLDVASALAAAGRDAREFLEMGGPNPQLQGEQGRATSGRAVLALQQAGLGALGPIFDRLHEWELRCYRSMWFRVQQFWTGPMYVRVTDDKNAAKFAAVNGAPVIGDDGQPMRRRPPEAPMMAMQDGPQGMSPSGMLMQPGGSDMPMRGVGDNGGPPIDQSEFETGPMLAELDMDIIIDRAPEAATLQAEQFETLAQLAQAQVLGPPNPEIARLIITASALPNKSELLDMLDKAAQQPQQPDPMQMAELKELAAKIEKMLADRDKTRAETAKIAAEIPKTQAEGERAAAQARSENVNATMNEIGATDALRGGLMGQPAYAFDPLAAAEPTGALGLPPSEAEGPPPY